jgi:hypothetical protein
MFVRCLAVLILFCSSFTALAYSYNDPASNTCAELRDDIAWLKRCSISPRICIDPLMMAEHPKEQVHDLRVQLMQITHIYLTKQCGAVPPAFPNPQCGSCF